MLNDLKEKIQISRRENTILQGRVFPPLIRFTLPFMLAVLVQALYGVVDLIVVGKFGSTASVSAVSNGSQIMHTVTAIIIGLTTGVTVVIGNCIGAKDEKGASDAVGATVKLFSIIAIAMTVLMILFAAPIARVMQVPEKAVAGTVTYIRVCSAGAVFIVAFNAISGLFRGVGDSKSPLLFITIACGVNIIGDFVLVGIFKMDYLGAALATVFAQALSVMFSVRKIRGGGLRFELRRDSFKKTGKSVKRIVRVGLPLAMQELLVSVSFLIIMAIINDISLVASASIGIAEKLFLVLAIVPMSFASSLSAFVAQNVGARQEQRALEAVGKAIIVSTAFGVVMTLMTYFKGDMLARIFEKNPEVIDSTAMYLRGIALEYLMIPPIFCMIGYFNGTGNTTFVMLEGLLTAFLVRVPLSYLFSRMPDTSLFKIGLAVPIAAFVSLIACTIYFFVIRKKRKTMYNN